jgi:hypothetical protein
LGTDGPSGTPPATSRSIASASQGERRAGLTARRSPHRGRVRSR